MNDLTTQITKLNNILASFETRLTTIENAMINAGEGLQYFNFLLYIIIGLTCIHFFFHMVVFGVQQCDR